MVFRSTYNYFRNQILRQNISGEYQKRRSSNVARIFFINGIFNISTGLIALYHFSKMSIVSIPYSSDLNTVIPLKQGKQYLYIELSNLYQNNLKYSKSINHDQLKGKTTDLNLSETAPLDYLNGLPIYPAGLIADTFFQDRISIEGVDLSVEDISWGRERDLIGMTDYEVGEFAYPPSWIPGEQSDGIPLNTTRGSGLPELDERFVNWIYLSAFPRARKLWGILDVPRDGEYPLNVQSFFDLSNKNIYITTEPWASFRNYFVPITLFTVGILSFFTALYVSKHAGRLDSLQGN